MVFGADDALMIAGIASAVSAIGSGAVGIASASSSNSSGSFGAQLHAMQIQKQYQQELMDKQFSLNRQLRQTAHQDEVADLMKAGLNPILSVNGGQTQSVGLGSQGLLDPSTGVSANASANQVRTQAMLGMANSISDVMLKYSNSALAQQQAMTEISKRDLNTADIALKSVQRERQEIENSNLPRFLEAQIEKELAMKEKLLTDSFVAKALLPSQINANNSSAVSARANYINATQGSPFKYTADKANSLLNSDLGRLFKRNLGISSKWIYNLLK